MALYRGEVKQDRATSSTLLRNRTRRTDLQPNDQALCYGIGIIAAAGASQEWQLSSAPASLGVGETSCGSTIDPSS